MGERSGTRLRSFGRLLIDKQFQYVVDNRLILERGHVLHARILLHVDGLRLLVLEELVTTQAAHVHRAITVAVDHGGLRVGKVFLFGERERLGRLETDAVETVHLDVGRLEIVHEFFSVFTHLEASLEANIEEQLLVVVHRVVA